MPSREEIFDKVKSALVDALGVDEDDVTPAATMVGDLGAESIDFLDIVFRLEKAFNIKISRGELFPEDVLSSSEFVADGKVTATGIAALKARMPQAGLVRLRGLGHLAHEEDPAAVADLILGRAEAAGILSPEQG